MEEETLKKLEGYAQKKINACAYLLNKEENEKQKEKLLNIKRFWENVLTLTQELMKPKPKKVR